MLRRAPAALLCLASIACWKEDYAAVPSGVLPFRPAVGGPEGWNVTAVDLPLACPDEGQAQVFVLSPASATGADPLPVALLLHAGSFDYVVAPIAGPNAAYLDGIHFADPSRLTAAWAANEVYTMLGMRPAQVPGGGDPHDGSLAVALAEAGIAVVMPANCWGDLWANQNTGTTNDFASDFFVRDGRTAADWTYRSLLDPAFADAVGVVWPFTPDPAETYLIGLGEGGRGVSELLAEDDDGDGTPTFAPRAVAVDSSPDDLRVVYDDAGSYAGEVEGLTRIFFDPPGPASANPGSLWRAPLPQRVAYLSSSLDPTWPVEVHEAARARIGGAGWAAEFEVTAPVVSNGAVPGLAADLVAYLTTGAIPSR